MKVTKCDRCGKIYPFNNWNDTIQINNEPRIDLCEKCIKELRLWLSNKSTNKSDNTNDIVENDN